MVEQNLFLLNSWQTATILWPDNLRETCSLVCKFLIFTSEQNQDVKYIKKKKKGLFLSTYIITQWQVLFSVLQVAKFLFIVFVCYRME